VKVQQQHINDLWEIFHKCQNKPYFPEMHHVDHGVFFYIHFWHIWKDDEFDSYFDSVKRQSVFDLETKFRTSFGREFQWEVSPNSEEFPCVISENLLSQKIEQQQKKGTIESGTEENNTERYTRFPSDHSNTETGTSDSTLTGNSGNSIFSTNGNSKIMQHVRKISSNTNKNKINLGLVNNNGTEICEIPSHVSVPPVSVNSSSSPSSTPPVSPKFSESRSKSRSDISSTPGSKIVKGKASEAKKIVSDSISKLRSTSIRLTSPRKEKEKIYNKDSKSSDSDDDNQNTPSLIRQVSLPKIASSSEDSDNHQGPDTLHTEADNAVSDQSHVETAEKIGSRTLHRVSTVSTSKPDSEKRKEKAKQKAKDKEKERLKTGIIKRSSMNYSIPDD